jgi:hypothetical protein
VLASPTKNPTLKIWDRIFFGKIPTIFEFLHENSHFFQFGAELFVGKLMNIPEFLHGKFVFIQLCKYSIAVECAKVSQGN